MDKSSVNKISYGLYVLTASENGRDNGCIINTLMQQTSTPLTVSVTVNKANLTHDMIKNTGLFNVSLLDTTAPFELFKHFGFQSGRNAQKFEVPESYGYAPCYSDNGLIYLKNHTAAFLSGKVTGSVDLGSHTLFTAEVTDGEVLSKNPSMTYAYYHNVIRGKSPKSSASGADTPRLKFKCQVCGYVYEGESLPADYTCPICQAGADRFEKL